jgi:hypothetical protein
MKKFIDHNASFLIACVWCVITLIWFYSCEPKVNSLTLQGRKVTRPQLVSEIESLNVQILARETDLDRQELIRKTISEHLSIIAQGGSFNTSGVLNLTLGILGLGSVLTYRKKDCVIKTLKNNAGNSVKTPG